MLSKTRDMEAAKRFFACALKAVGQTPEKVATDGHDSYPRAVRFDARPRRAASYQSLHDQSD